MKVIVDAMGGDNAPEEIVKGSIEAARSLGVEVVLVGDVTRIKKIAGNQSGVTIVHASEVISGEEEPMRAIRAKTDSSMVRGLKMLSAGEGDAFVSAGNSGALVAGATLIVRRISGVRRVALAPIIPTETGSVILVDGGANVDCSAELLQQFAVMGNAYAKTVLDVEAPRVGLLNNGTEASKGGEEVQGAYKFIHALPLDFVGNIEARDVLDGVCDVLVADGFTGNILLKSIEGTAMYFSKNLKAVLMKNLATKISALLLKGGIGNMRKKFDYNEHGGAPVLGAKGVVIKAHGSSKSLAFYNAIRQAKKFYEAGAVGSIEELIARAGSPKTQAIRSVIDKAKTVLHRQGNPKT